ncbi:tetratricopeptide repeat protein [Hydrocarboniphaga sp.]|uniref:tetratricopeptide repeat protein n=1 Tax=Hydrocarboniphaga sp. TaxID=2033016 RepID=UPI00260776A1|nr:tetratricopeptide repeat protein [Hydrocarboniphaga sp.]
MAAAEAALERSRLRRHWAYGIAASLGLGLIVSLLLFWEATQQRRAAQRALAMSEAVVEFLDRDLLRAADPLEAGGNRNVTVANVLDKASRSLRARFADQPEVSQRLAYTIARAYQSLGLGEQGRQLLLAELEAHKAADSPQLRRLRFLLADIDTEYDRYAESASLLDGLLADLRASHEEQGSLAFDVRLSRAWLDFELGYYEQSRVGFMAILEDLARWRPDDRETRMTAQWWMVDPLRELGRLEEADARLGEVLADYVGIYDANNARYLWARTSLGNLRISQRRFEEAEAVLLDVEQRIRSSLGDSHNIGLFATYFRGVLRLRQGRVAEALPFLEESYRLRKQYQGEGSHSTWLAANRLAQALSKLGQVERVGHVLDPAYESAVRNVGLDHPYSIRLASTRVQHLLLRGQVDTASEQLALALEHVDARLPALHVTRAELLYRQAQIRLSRGDIVGAREKWLASAAMLRELGEVPAAEMAERLAAEAANPAKDWLQKSTLLPV